ncbi:hypothetical protein Tco_1336842 [Tanacetum coccineum]
MAEPLPPDHVFDFPANDLAPELEDLVMEVEEDLEEDLDMDIDEDEEDYYQITTSDFIPWIPPTQASTYEVGGPSLVVPEAPHPVGRHVSVVAFRVVQHRREIRALYVKAYKMEDMQTRALSLVRKVDGVSDAQVVDSIVIAKLQPRMTAVEEGVHTLAEQEVLVASKLDETETQVLEMRDIVDNYPHGQVDALR